MFNPFKVKKGQVYRKIDWRYGDPLREVITVHRNGYATVENEQGQRTKVRLDRFSPKSHLKLTHY